nr:hypothetical protein [Rhodococcus sp. (in: high G+C Gram-positive bacteria)]
MIIVLGICFVTVSMLGIAAHVVDSTNQGMLVAGALARPLLFCSVPGAVLLAVGFGWFGAVVGAIAVIGAAWTQSPLWKKRFGSKPTGEVPFTVLHANILLGKADADAVVALVDRHEPDVLTVVELTPSAHRGLLAAGLGGGSHIRSSAAHPGATAPASTPVIR